MISASPGVLDLGLFGGQENPDLVIETSASQRLCVVLLDYLFFTVLLFNLRTRTVGSMWNQGLV